MMLSLTFLWLSDSCGFYKISAYIKTFVIVAPYGAVMGQKGLMP